MKRIALFVLGFLVCYAAFADIEGRTSEGRKVLLKDDGTWEFVEEKAEEKNEQYDFKKVHWGSSQAHVKESETSELVMENELGLYYKGEIAGLDVMLAYFFTNDLLVRTNYIVMEEHSNRNAYIDDFNTLKGLLSTKYGTPQDDDKHWKNSLFKDDYSDWGTAISIGHLVYQASWELERSGILLTLGGDNYKITLGLQYTGTEFKGIERQKTTEKALDNL